jgi:hypothetical protein
MADPSKLNPDLNIISVYAKEFGIDPDDVYGLKTFSTVINFLVEFKNRAEYERRLNDLNKAFKQ